MPNTYVSGNNTTTINQVTGETIVVLPGAQITTNGSGVRSNSSTDNDLDISVYGSIFSSEHGVSYWGTSDGTFDGDGSHQVWVGTGGIVHSAGDIGWSGVLILGSFGEIINNGEISGSYAVSFRQSPAPFLSNQGVILGNFLGVYLNRSYQGEIINSGTIAADYWGIRIAESANTNLLNTGSISASYFGIEVSGSSYSAIVNEGEIVAEIGIMVASSPSPTNQLAISNSGSIVSTNKAVVVHDGQVNLLNSGKIVGGDFPESAIHRIAIDVENADFRLTNTGTIIGDVKFTGSNDQKITNSGDILGNIQFDEGDDFYFAFGQGLVTEGVAGGGGNDTMVGGALADSFAGDGGNDILAGKSGDDTLDGGTGNDTLRGGEGDDSLIGGNGNDTLRGEDGDDYLEGGHKDDKLIGGAGNDTLVAGGGKDGLIGGEGKDLFVFSSTSGSSSLIRKSIVDFEAGVDRIDLSGLSNPLSFVGSGPFTGGGTASVRVVLNASGNDSVFVDEDGDGVADLRIKVPDVSNIEASDFVL